MASSTQPPEVPNNMAETELMSPKLIFTRLGLKLLRFVYLGQMYYCYQLLEDLPGVNLHGFPPVYIYAWVLLSVLIGLFLFMFGKTALFDSAVADMMSSLNWSFVNRLCDGSVCRFFCLWLHWLYPYIVVSAYSCYTELKIPHSRFVLTYYTLLAFVELKDYRAVRWSAMSLTSAAHAYLSLMAGNPWGVSGACLMSLNLLLLLRGDDNDEDHQQEEEENTDSELLRPRILKKIPRPAILAFSSLTASYTVAMSIQMMSSRRGEEMNQEVPHVSLDELLDGVYGLIN